MSQPPPMQDPSAKPRQGFLQESFIRGVAAGRNQIASHNSGIENEAPTKTIRPDRMVTSRANDAEMEKSYPGFAAMKRDAAVAAQQPLTPSMPGSDTGAVGRTDDGGVDVPRIAAEKQIMSDEVSRHMGKSPRARQG